MGDQPARQGPHLVLTLHVEARADAEAVLSCTNIAGETVVTCDVELSSSLLAVRQMVAESCEMDASLIQIMLPDGRVLRESDDGVQLATLLSPSEPPSPSCRAGFSHRRRRECARRRGLRKGTKGVKGQAPTDF